MNPYFESLKAHIKVNLPNFGDGESVLTMLYECYNENNPYDNEQIRSDFNELYQQMNGMPLREMDNNTVFNLCCRLCRAYERKAFRDGILCLPQNRKLRHGRSCANGKIQLEYPYGTAPNRRIRAEKTLDLSV